MGIIHAISAALVTRMSASNPDYAISAILVNIITQFLSFKLFQGFIGFGQEDKDQLAQYYIINAILSFISSFAAFSGYIGKVLKISTNNSGSSFVLSDWISAALQVTVG